MNNPCKDCPDLHAHCGLQMQQRTRQMQSAESRSAEMSENTDYTKQERVERRESKITPYHGIAESR